MNELFYIVSQSVSFFLSAITLLMLLRAIMSLFTDEESLFYVFCCVVTEPVIAPVRALLYRVPALEELPIDLSFMATYLVILIVQSALPVSW